MKKLLLLIALTCVCVAQGLAQSAPPSTVMAGQYGSSYFGVNVNSAGALITTSGAGAGYSALPTPPTAVLATGVYYAAVTLGASPYAYTVSAPGIVTVTGGTVSSLTLTHVGNTTTLAVPATIYVSTGDVVTIAYSVAPTVQFGIYTAVQVDGTGALIVSGGGGGGGMVYPGPGIANSNGSAWLTSFGPSNPIPASYIASLPYIAQTSTTNQDGDANQQWVRCCGFQYGWRQHQRQRRCESCQHEPDDK